MQAFKKLPYSINKIRRVSKLYNKAFYTKVFTLFASGESEVNTFARLQSPHFAYCIVFNENFEGPYFLDDAGLERVRAWVLQKAKNDPKKIFFIHHLWQKGWFKYLNLSKRLLRLDLTMLTDAQLYRQFSEFYRRYLEAGGFAYFCDSFMSTGESDFLEVLVRKELKKIGFKGDTAELVRLLTFPESSSFAFEEEYELEKLRNLFKKKFGSNFSSLEKIEQKYPSLFRKLKRHEQSYFWIRNNYYNVDFYSVQQIYKKLRQKGNYGGSNKENESKKLRAKRRHLLTRLPISAFIKNTLKIAQLFAHWKDVRKSGVYIGMHHFDKFLQELARRRKIAKMDLTFLVFDEIEDFFLRRKDFALEISERKKKIFYTITPRGYYIVGGKKAKKYFAILKRSQRADTDEVRGVCASSGHVTGRARVIKTTEDMKRMKSGEILITNQTTPDFVPTMRKARAIVTEQGGITSHAAVVARELRKPCVIGTKVATKIFKDGDLIEVNANHGWVRKIK